MKPRFGQRPHQAGSIAVLDHIALKFLRSLAGLKVCDHDSNSEVLCLGPLFTSSLRSSGAAKSLQTIRVGHARPVASNWSVLVQWQSYKESSGRSSEKAAKVQLSYELFKIFLNRLAQEDDNGLTSGAQEAGSSSTSYRCCALGARRTLPERSQYLQTQHDTDDTPLALEPAQAMLPDSKP